MRANPCQQAESRFASLSRCRSKSRAVICESQPLTNLRTPGLQQNCRAGLRPSTIANRWHKRKLRGDNLRNSQQRFDLCLVRGCGSIPFLYFLFCSEDATTGRVEGHYSTHSPLRAGVTQGSTTAQFWTERRVLIELLL